MTATERTIADALVSIVCRCRPRQHERGFPECDTARRAARAALQSVADTQSVRAGSDGEPTSDPATTSGDAA